MSTLIRSDIYRMRRSAAFRNTSIVLLVIMAVFAATFVMIRSEAFTSFVESGVLEQIDGEEAEQYLEIYDEGMDELPANAAEFTNSLMGENILLFFFIPVVLTVFCADFTNGTYRNTLSYESNRTKVYMAKWIVSAVSCFLLQILMVVAGWIMGAIAFGSFGFSAGYFVKTLIGIILILPGQLATVSFIHCLIAYTKKSSSTIGIFIGVSLGSSMVLQMLTMIPQFSWLSYLDWNTSGNMLMNYWNAPLTGIVLAVGTGLAVTVVSTVLGLMHYRKADLTL